MEVNWERLAKRLLVANQIGIRIEQADGHRWIIEDATADFCCHLTVQPRMGTEHWITKEYGSVSAALDQIDKLRVGKGLKPLEQEFAVSYNYLDDLGVVFGEGTQ